jgi:hypothetical protein
MKNCVADDVPRREYFCVGVMEDGSGWPIDGTGSVYNFFATVNIVGVNGCDGVIGTSSENGYLPLITVNSEMCGGVESEVSLFCLTQVIERYRA